MSNSLHDVYIKGSDSVIYKAIFALDNGYYLVCNSNLEATDLPLLVMVVKGEPIENNEWKF